MSKLEAVEALLWSRDDVVQGPKTAKLTPGKGQSRGVWKLCPECEGMELSDRFGRPMTCAECNGAGRFRVDKMTGERVGTVDETPVARKRMVMCDRCGGDGAWKGSRCDMCDGSGKVGVPFSSVSESPRNVLDDGTPLQRLRARGDWDRVEATGLKYAAEIAQVLDGRVKCPGEIMAAYRARGERARLSEIARVKRVYKGGRRKRLARELLRGGESVAAVATRLGVSERQVRRLAA